MTVKENNEKLEKLQTRVGKLVDELHVMKQNVADFKLKVSSDINRIVTEIGKRHGE
tara:strand:- start:208 stop:375 length:168 start_codon:yes stop_codon:yes gene_type:complete